MKKQVLFICMFIGMLLIAACGGKDDMSTNPDCPDCPVITDITPASGLPGTEITITGKNFTGLESVLFDGANAVAITPSKTTATQTMVITPDIPNKNGPVKVTVTRKFTNGGGTVSTLTSTEDITFTYTKAPEIANIAPLFAKKGETLTITGKYFGSAPVVKFPNGSMVPASTFTDSEIRIAVPSKAGTGKIQVLSGGQTVTSVQDFTYLFSYTVSTVTTLDDKPGDLDFYKGPNDTEGRMIASLSVEGNSTYNRLWSIKPSGVKTEISLASLNATLGTLGGGFKPGGRYTFVCAGGTYDGIYYIGAGENTVGGNFGELVDYWSQDIAWLNDDIMLISSVQLFGTFLKIVQINNQNPIVTTVNAGTPFAVCAFGGAAYAVDGYALNRLDGTTLAVISGSLSVKGYTDGPLTSARFDFLYGGIAMNEYNKIFVADGKNNCIRLIDQGTGFVSTIAGSTTAGMADGPGESARFNQPQGICFDDKGNLLVADTKNKAIRKITIE